MFGLRAVAEVLGGVIRERWVYYRYCDRIFEARVCWLVELRAILTDDHGFYPGDQVNFEIREILLIPGDTEPAIYSNSLEGFEGAVRRWRGQNLRLRGKVAYARTRLSPDKILELEL